MNLQYNVNFTFLCSGYNVSLEIIECPTQENIFKNFAATP